MSLAKSAIVSVASPTSRREVNFSASSTVLAARRDSLLI